MKIDARWAWLLDGQDKVGAGVQGATNLAELDRFDPSLVLFLAPEFGFADHYGPRAMIRTPHHDKPWWTDPERWAEEGANNLAIVYPKGTRKYQSINEIWGIEGLSDQEHHYRWMGEEWTPRFLDALEAKLHARGIPLHPEPDGVQVGLFAPSPGRNYEDNFVGLRHLAPVFRDPRIAFSIEHYYWEQDGGFLDGQWWRGPERMLKVRQKMLDLGVDKPVLVGEFNRRIVRDNPDDVRAYAAQVKRYHQWLNSLDWVIGACNFLWSCGDWATDFYDLTVTRTPGLAALLSDGWDRLSEGEWHMPVVGQGFQKCEALVGPWLEDEVYHFSGTDRETSMAVGEKGVAVWRRATNETTAICDDGSHYTDYGNDVSKADGRMHRIYPLA